MNKILTTALGLLVGGVMTASAYTASTTVYSTNRDKIKSVNVWGGNTGSDNKHSMTRVAGSGGNGYYYTTGKTFTDIQIHTSDSPSTADFGQNSGQYSTSSGYIMEYYTTSAKTINSLTLWMKINGSDKNVYFTSQDEGTPYMFKSDKLTSDGNVVLYGYKNGASSDTNGDWLWDAGVTGSGNGAYSGVFTQGAGTQNLNIPSGTQYHFELNVIDQTITVVYDSTPEPVEVTQDLYLHVEGVKDTSGWASHFYLGNKMETEYSQSFETSGDTFNFVFSDNSSITWNPADGFYAPKDNNLPISLDSSTTQEQNKGKAFFYAGNGAGTYTVKAKYNSDHTAVTFTVTKDNGGGGEDENPEDPEGYEYTEIVIENPESPADDHFTSYYIPKPSLEANSNGYKKVFAVSHSHRGQGSLEYTWVKYHDRNEGYSSNWMYYESDDNIPAHDTETVAMIQSHVWYENFTAEQIANRSHAVNNNSGDKHDCRNFSDAYYRVYGEMPKHPDADKAAAQSRLRGHIIPDNIVNRKARVAYTLLANDNTSGIEEVEVDNTAAAEGSDAAPVYYNLQGVVVAHPQAGQVYIVRRGDVVTKEVIR